MIESGKIYKAKYEYKGCKEDCWCLIVYCKNNICMCFLISNEKNDNSSPDNIYYIPNYGYIDLEHMKSIDLEDIKSDICVGCVDNDTFIEIISKWAQPYFQIFCKRNKL